MWDFIKSLWPRSPFTWLGLILGTISVLKLIEFGFNHGFGPTFTVLLTYYENLLHAVFGWWAEPFIRAWLAELSAYFGWDLHLYPHWKHVFVLMGIYFFRAAGETTARHGALYSAYSVVVGGAIALGASIAASTLPLSGNDTLTNILICAIPIAGVALFDFLRDVRRAVWFRVREAATYNEPVKSFTAYLGETTGHNLRRLAAGILIAIVGVQLPLVSQLQSPATVILGVLVVVLALHRLRIGAINAPKVRKEGESWPSAFSRTYSARVGLSILGVFFWTGVFIAANAGLRFYGL